MLINRFNLLIINILQTYVPLDISLRQSSRLPRSSTRSAPPDAASLERERLFKPPHSLPTLTVLPSKCCALVLARPGRKKLDFPCMTANKFRFRPAVDQCPSKLFETEKARTQRKKSAFSTWEYLATQLAVNSWGRFFTHANASVKSPQTYASTPRNVILPGEVLTISAHPTIFFHKAKRLLRLV